MSLEREIRRLRHEGARRRELTVASKTLLSDYYLSIRFTCDDFADFVSAGADDHVKLFVPDRTDAHGKPLMRDYTPRAFDRDAGEITIDFAMHDDPGPATGWAIAARIGDRISIGGPRGSAVIPESFDWYWLIGDETAIPAISRRIDEWPATPLQILIAVRSQEKVPLVLGPHHSVQWLHCPAGDVDDTRSICAALARWQLPEGEGFVWIAAEAAAAKAVREHLIDRGHPAHRMKAAGYWVRGQADAKAHLD